MALASKTDVETRLRRTLTDGEKGPEDRWINGILDEASALVTAYCGRDSFDSPVPDAVRLVTSRVAARVVAAAAAAGGGIDQPPTKIGPIEWPAPTPDAAAGGGWLSRVDKQMLEPWVTGHQVFSVDLA